MQLPCLQKSVREATGKWMIPATPAPRQPFHVALPAPPSTQSIGRFTFLRYTPRQIALLPGDAQHLVVVEADHNEYNEAQGQVRGELVVVLSFTKYTPVLSSLLSPGLCGNWSSVLFSEVCYQSFVKFCHLWRARLLSFNGFHRAGQRSRMQRCNGCHLVWSLGATAVSNMIGHQERGGWREGCGCWPFRERQERRGWCRGRFGPGGRGRWRRDGARRRGGGG